VEGFKDKSSCEKDRGPRSTRAHEEWRKNIREAQARAGESYSIEALGTTSTRIREAPKSTDSFNLTVYKCFPDTIDPRGPKGAK